MSIPSISLAGKVAVVTGSSRGKAKESPSCLPRRESKSGQEAGETFSARYH